MKKDPTEFRKRFAKWKAGAKPYQYGVPYEDDNHNIDYDQARANQLNYSADKTGHYPTRDYETGRYLKSPIHPTVTLGTYTDMGLGYDVWYNKLDKSLYSQPNFTSTYKDRLPKYGNGKNPATSVMITPSIISMVGLIKRAGQYLRNRMYKTVHPSGYTMENVENFIKGTPRKTYDNPNTEAAFGKYTNQDSIYTAGYNRYLKDLKIPHRVLTLNEIKKLKDDKYRVAPYDDEYDGISKVAVKDLLVPSRHVKDAYEFVYPNSPGQYPTITKNGNVGDKLWLHSHTLGTYEKGTDQDNKGVYDYYRDTWDINPFKGFSAVDDGSTLFKTGNTIGLDYFDDIIPFGNPFKIEGRIYR